MSRYLFLLTAASLAFAGTAAAQLRGVKADVTPLAEADGTRAGSDARIALQVTLPNGFHVQSNKPRDPDLIPTTLNIDVPAGITVAEIVCFPGVKSVVLKEWAPLSLPVPVVNV